ncbi:MAG TPA: hypothetical protein VKU40_03760 [Thermoanaerobaculia bacterium]|nr:hypothetical protein [Thermoanaerobaculia bacterium]
MHKIDEKPYGFKVTFHGFMQGEDVERFNSEMKRNADRQREDFAVLVDLRETRTFPPEAQMGLMEIINYCRERGMNRNAVVVNSAITKIQANRLAKEGNVEHIRFIDCAGNDDWEQQAEDWLVHGKEPARMAS